MRPTQQTAREMGKFVNKLALRNRTLAISVRLSIETLANARNSIRKIVYAKVNDHIFTVVLASGHI